MPNYLINFFLICFVIFFINTLIKKIKRLNNFSGQKHQILTKKNAIPLSGGLVLIISIFMKLNLIEMNLLFFLVLIFLVGFLADLRILKSPLVRFGIQIIIVFLFIIYLDLTILEIRILWFDNLLINKNFNIFFVLFCFLVLINGSNFIDGNNTLALGYYSLIIFIFLAINEPSLHNQYFSLVSFIFITLLALLTFNLFNKLYLGDGGVYLLSTFVGFLLVKLYSENQNISPFFIVNLLWYPSFEILFSLIRKIKTKYSPMDPDTQHLHQLIFRKYLLYFDNKAVISNSFTGLTINLYHLIIFYISYTNLSKSFVQGYLLLLNIGFYLFIYFLLKKNLFIKK
jgi:UDP-N-acetylmuramyl pentapeptide phosphotransferase/UDP-N-acetylglucosamine-1-phosphate transferase